MADKQTIIGPGTTIAGEVRGDENLIVKGRIDGRVSLSETLTVEAGGIVQADIEVKGLVVSGVVVGSIIATESVRLLDKAKVVGDIQAPRVSIEAGAAYRGRIEMGEGAPRAKAERATSAVRETAVGAKVPPRMAPPPRTATASQAPRMSAPPSSATRPAPPPAPRVAGTIATPSSVVSASGNGAPAWARKKLKRR